MYIPDYYYYCDACNQFTICISNLREQFWVKGQETFKVYNGVAVFMTFMTVSGQLISSFQAPEESADVPLAADPVPSGKEGVEGVEGVRALRLVCFRSKPRPTKRLLSYDYPNYPNCPNYPTPKSPNLVYSDLVRNSLAWFVVFFAG